AFFLDVGEGELLFLRRPLFESASRAGTFPNEDFTLVRLPNSKRIIHFVCRGGSVETEPAPPGPRVDLGSIPDGALVPARLETLLGDLAVLLASDWKPA